MLRVLSNKIRFFKKLKEGMEKTDWPWKWEWGGIGEGGTFEKVDSKTGFVNGPVRDELEPEAAGRALDVIRLLVATVAPDEGAALTVPVAHLQVVIGAAVMALNLGVRGPISEGALVASTQHPEPVERWAVLGATGA